MVFGPQSKKGSYHYLTTQYSDDDDVPETFPLPTNALKDDFPLVPTLMGNLVLQQVNHHDFYDNLYRLLQGRKRFVLYLPSQSHHLHPHGKIKKVHPNGLVSYEHRPVRSDGLSSYDAAKYKILALKKRLSESKLRLKTRAMDVKLVKKAYEEARNAFRELQGDSANADLAGNDADNAEVILTSDPEEEDPSSFSGIPTSALHSHLNLPTTTAPPSTTNPPTFSFLCSLKSTGPPFILIAIRHSHGIQLLVPPPIALDKFVLPYKDVLGWKYLRDEQRAVYGVKKGLKRKTEEKNAPATSTRPINKEKRLNLQGLLLNVDFVCPLGV
ncbi:hypothetical protein FRC04_006700 [Tulasnella sp. 424]|nr:hypothetical protein FRC04_006700 [Tulasnella sp. 424]